MIWLVLVIAPSASNFDPLVLFLMPLLALLMNRLMGHMSARQSGSTVSFLNQILFGPAFHSWNLLSAIVMSTGPCTGQFLLCLWVYLFSTQTDTHIHTHTRHSYHSVAPSSQIPDVSLQSSFQQSKLSLLPGCCAGAALLEAAGSLREQQNFASSYLWSWMMLWHLIHHPGLHPPCHPPGWRPYWPPCEPGQT